MENQQKAVSSKQKAANLFFLPSAFCLLPTAYLFMQPKEKRYKWRRAEYQEKTRGLLIVNTGHGKGKTTCALGLMMRAAGQGLHCCMIQFMKSRNDRYGEHVSAEKLGIEIHTMGDGFTWDTKNPEQDRQTARATWNLCVEKLKSGDYDLLVFDELVYVLSYGMLPVDEVISEIRAARETQPALHVVVTGRDAPKELIDAADLVTEMSEIKHPFQAGIRAQRGIEF
jgi:cob(I)alamin adenosyltransferase